MAVRKKDGPYGGRGGSVWDDFKAISSDEHGNVIQIVSLDISHSTSINFIQAIYLLDNGKTSQPQRHGETKNDDKLNTLNSNLGEVIAGISIGYGRYLNRISLFTMKPDGTFESHGPFDGNSGVTHDIAGKVLGFFGRADRSIDALGFHVDR